MRLKLPNSSNLISGAELRILEQQLMQAEQQEGWDGGARGHAWLGVLVLML